MFQKFTLTTNEIFSLLRSWLAISVAFAILLNEEGLEFSYRFLVLMAIAAGTVGVGFLLHEMAHKVLALKYNLRAHYVSFDFWLVGMILFAMFFKFLFAIPGAVFIEGNVTARKNGIISAVGPLTNIFLAIIFLFAFIAFRETSFAIVAFYGLSINSTLAVFNMLPILNMDGTKILAWSKAVYFSMVAFSIALMMISFVIRA